MSITKKLNAGFRKIAEREKYNRTEARRKAGKIQIITRTDL